MLGRALFTIALPASLAALVFACSSPDADAIGSDQAITGSIADAKACAVRDGYVSADLSAFQHISASALPAGVPATSATAIERFNVVNIGTVFLVETAAGLGFYDGNGALLARAHTSGSSLAWSQPSGASVQCGVVATPDAGPPPPPPTPGASCSVQDQLFSRACGHCGTAQAVCERSPTNGSLRVSEYSVCAGEHGVCVPGETVACGNCGTSTCGSSCTPGACHDEGECKPGVITHTSAGCLPGTYRARSCSDTCSAGPYGACASPEVSLPDLGETSTTQWTLDSGSQAKRPSACTVTASLTPVHGIPVVLRNPSATDATVQVWHSSAGISVDTVITIYANAVPATDDDFRACQKEPVDSCTQLGAVCGADGSGSWAGVNNVRVPANSAIVIYNTGWSQATSGPFVLHVRTIAH